MNSVVRNSVAAFTFALLCVTSADAQGQAAAPQLAKEIVPIKAGSSNLRVTSSMFNSGDTLPERFTQNGENVSPPITWLRGPAGTLSYVVSVRRREIGNYPGNGHREWLPATDELLSAERVMSAMGRKCHYCAVLATSG